MPNFELSKWYMDCVSEAGDVVVAYRAELRWRRIRLLFASVLVGRAGEVPTSLSTVRASAEPELIRRALSWSCPALGVEGRWHSLAAPVGDTMFESEKGRVEWLCHQPRGDAEITVGGRSVRGLGYAEHVKMTIEPWRMPIDELRWGRFVGQHHSLVWIDWRGGYSKRLVLLDGSDVGPCLIDDSGVTGDPGTLKLSIDEGRVLRSGSLGKTALARVPRLGRFPARILAVEETKWCAPGTLDGAPGRDHGWVIHEVVRWPAGEPSRPTTQWVGKVLYGLFFAVLLPVLLVAWAGATAAAVHAPGWRAPFVGSALAAAGAVLIVAGWASLWRHGGGLPMNAFPPPRHVTLGVYALLAHPIYAGFTASCFGVSVALGSPSGLWLVSPAVALASVALVLGYEAHDLRARFPGARPSPWLGLPEGDDAPPRFPERLSALILGLGPWLVAAAVHARATDAGVFALALGAPLVAFGRRDLRRLVVHALLAVPLVLPLHLVLPFVTPSARTMLALLAADAIASRMPRARIGWRGLALALSARDLAPQGAGVVGVLASVGAFSLVVNAAGVWSALRKLTERVANSWQEKRVGPVRIINHGVWAGLGTFGGVAIVGTLVGPVHLGMVVFAAFASLVCSALWAQWVEGSPSLLRPYGFYGGLLGVCAAALASPLFGMPVWLLLGAYAVAGPYVQAMGRIRCLVQGCCHGRETSPSVGIRYRHPRSRVCRLSGGLTNVPIHATPLYSILCNGVTALVLGRLWTLHAPLHLIGGVYLVMSGLGRFVEEAYRGEPQTPVFAQLRLYQWIALGSVVAGALVTSLGRSANAPPPEPNASCLVAGLFFGLVTWVAMGVDFPESKRRFSRLA
jgi:protein-S-isoprenylcysteine O-methyltransferase Ste14